MITTERVRTAFERHGRINGVMRIRATELANKRLARIKAAEREEREKQEAETQRKSD